jgi:hypothetical protein
MKEYRNQWHPGCSGAMELELRRASDEEEKITICTGKKARHWDWA